MQTLQTSVTIGLLVDVVRGVGAERDEAEAALDDQGVLLPLPQRAFWMRACGSNDALIAVAREEGDRPVAAVGVSIAASRALPGHRLYRIARMSAAGRDSIDAMLIGGVVAAAKRDALCLRVSVEVFERDETRRARLTSALAAYGFIRTLDMRSYQQTLALELAPGADALLTRLAASVRRNIREPVKRGLEIRQVSDAALAPRLDALLRETYRRTGGVAPQLPWRSLIELSTREPHRSRICGLFDPMATGSDMLVGYAWGAVHGDYVSYEAGGSTRRADLGRTPLAYAPLWDLIAWASRTHATWFDLGGVTPGTNATADDPLGGISDFKRHFSQTLVNVGAEWVLEPRPVRASIAHAVSALGRRLGGGGR
jgi:hypothetical protein